MPVAIVVCRLGALSAVMLSSKNVLSVGRQEPSRPSAGQALRVGLG